MNKPTDFQIRNGVLERYTGRSSSVIIPEGVQSIDKYAFYAVGAIITSVTLPSSLSYINRDNFTYCTKLEEILVNEGNRYFESVDGVLFEKGLIYKLRIFPAGKAGAYTVPDGVNMISTGAFFGCERLTNLTLPDSLNIIGGDFLKNCTAIQSITIPRSVVMIEGYCFISCSSLEKIAVDADNQRFASIDGILYDKNIRKLIACPANKSGAFSIPETVTTIGAHAFHCCRKLTEITISDSVASMETGAFFHCENLKSATIPGTVQKIIRYTFAGCTALRDITIANGVKEIESRVFDGCSQLKALTIPESVTVMPPNAFEGDIYYENRPLNLIPPQHSKKRALLGFVQNCTGETAPDIKNSYIKYFKLQRSKQFFEDLTVNLKLLQFALDNGIMTYELAEKVLEAVPDGEHTEIRVLLIDYMNKEDEKADPLERLEKELNKSPFSVKELKKEWIYSPDENGDIILKSYKGEKLIIICPNKIGTRYVTAIKKDCFSPAAAHITPKMHRNRQIITAVTVTDGIKTIGSNAFYMCERLQEVRLPESLTEIGEAAFGECPFLTAVNIPDNVAEIGENAFSECLRLGSVNIPDSIRIIRPRTFAFCEKLTSVTIPEGVFEIGNQAFRGCKRLVSVTLPESVRMIALNAFQGCPGLKITAPAGSYAEQYAKSLHLL